MYRDKGSTPVLRCGDRLPNFQDSRSDFARTDGKEAVNGFPARKSEEEEDADFQRKKRTDQAERLDDQTNFQYWK